MAGSQGCRVHVTAAVAHANPGVDESGAAAGRREEGAVA